MHARMGFQRKWAGSKRGSPVGRVVARGTLQAGSSRRAGSTVSGSGVDNRKLGRWAVSENNRLLPGDALTFRRVTGGEQQVVDGMNYRLDIDASSGRNDINGSYKAVVYEQDWTNTRKLISFDKNHS
ncbi:hypothetical protein E2562_004805 [Oryza meyeriana var. granulata]|uniref:Cystatin domain-containing protein n=1 Tax=Oryza meyeriana var. granulata TaxID=110450 RepID=A0A6G1DEM0_9ORYZ|nr:hypothetical protein E2562_004805 [Oryza meyeriana var. granulata]